MLERELTDQLRSCVFGHEPKCRRPCLHAVPTSCGLNGFYRLTLRLRNICMRVCRPCAAMSEQLKLEDVGVKRARQDPDGESGLKAVTDTQPQPKKAHTDPHDAKQSRTSDQSKSKENQGSISNASAKDKQPVKERATLQPKEAGKAHDATADQSAQSEPKPEQPAQEAANASDAKQPLSSAVPKPEGDVGSRLSHTYAPDVHTILPQSTYKTSQPNCRVGRGGQGVLSVPTSC